MVDDVRQLVVELQAVFFDFSRQGIATPTKQSRRVLAPAP
jgi:hypothetical protein